MIVFLLTLVWIALWGTFDSRTILTGLLYSGVSTAIVRQLYQKRRPHQKRQRGIRWWVVRLGRITHLGLVFLWELVRSTLQVTVEILRPRLRIKPAILAVPLDAKSDVQITVFANLVSLTPGTLSIEVSPDRRVLFVHALTIDDDGTEIVRSTKERLESRVMRAL